jgi:cobalt-zinc-cadmium efflux system protein
MRMNMPDHDHHHDHPHPAARPPDGAHEHAVTTLGSSRKLLLALVLTGIMMIVEVIGGMWSGSLALLADAAHMMVDTLALLLAVVGAWMATKPADARRSYGYGRMEVLAGFVNALSQFVLVAWIVWEAAVRLRHPSEILSGVMLVVAVAGLLVNALVLRTLHGHAHDDVNLAGASLHVLGDLLGSVAAVLAALAIRWFHWLWADPLLSLLVSLLILNSAWRLLRKSAHILLEGVPEGIDTHAVETSLRTAAPGICDIHHLHVWQLASGSRMATVHAELEEGADGAMVLQSIKRVLLEQFTIRHVTVQIDPGACSDPAGDCAGHDHR